MAKKTDVPMALVSPPGPFGLAAREYQVDIYHQKVDVPNDEESDGLLPKHKLHQLIVSNKPGLRSIG